MTDDPGPSPLNISQDKPEWTRRVDAALDQLQQAGQTITYREMAERLRIPGPGSIQALTHALEATMAFDAQANQPPRASLVLSRHRPGLPAEGFFERARQLGMMTNEDPVQIHQRWLQALLGDRGSSSQGER